MHKVLITKKLNRSQQALALDYNLDVVEESFVKITYEYDTIVPPKAEAWILTSSNAANYISSHFEEFPASVLPQTIYCIGSSTAQPINHLGIAIKMPSYATADNLADLVLEDAVQTAIFFSGNLRKDTIMNRLSSLITCTEIQVYQTELLEKTVDLSDMEAVAFFSPSGVQAFSKQNSITTQKVVAIGSATKQAVREYLQVEAGIATHASVEDVLFALKDELN